MIECQLTSKLLFLKKAKGHETISYRNKNFHCKKEANFDNLQSTKGDT